MRFEHKLLICMALLACPPAASADDEDAVWAEILAGAEAGERPAPREAVVWLTDLEEGFAQARAEDRPLFVTFRCLPCKQCADFDKEVLEGGPALDPLLKQMVTVRLTDARHLDLRLFPAEGFQDFDLSWWGWFLSPEGRTYAVFGGRDHESDSTRISVAALGNTLERVLAHRYDPRRPGWDVDGPLPDLEGEPRTPDRLPGWESWAAKNPEGFELSKACVHCHQVAEVLRQPAIDARRFEKPDDLFVWPLPENVGIELDRDDGLRVNAVASRSPAAKAGLRAGDVLAAGEGRRLFGQADLRGVLHRGPEGRGRIHLRWLREGEPREGTLRVRPGWRETRIGWRMSVSQGNVGGALGFFPLRANAGERRRAGGGEGLVVKAWFGPERNGPPQQAGLKRGELVVAINGQSPDLWARELLTWFRLRTEPGDRVRLTVVDGHGNRRELEYRLPEPR